MHINRILARFHQQFKVNSEQHIITIRYAQRKTMIEDVCEEKFEFENPRRKTEHNLLLTVHNLLLTVHNLLLAVHNLLLTVHNLLLTMHNLQLTEHC